MSRLARLVLALSLALAACDRSLPPPARKAVDTPRPTQVTARKPPAPDPATKPDPAARALAASQTAFALELYRAVAADHAGNLALSPASLALALAMARDGAAGATRTELDRLLHEDGVAGLDDAHAALSHALAAGSPGVVLALADRVWAQHGAAIEPGYVQGLADHYGADLGVVDFATGDGARQTINTWVAAHTASKITDLIPAGGVGATTKVVLSNAIYFKGRWAEAFARAATTDDDFQLAGGAAKVATMHRTGRFTVAEVAGVKAVTLPYAGDDVELVAILPAASGVAGLERALEPALLARLDAAAAPSELSLSLPRWQSSAALALGAAVRGLGARHAFAAGADFSAISKDPAGLFLGEVFHAVWLAVDEEGTEAVAATALSMADAAPTIPELRFDRPFVYLIRQRTTGAILFMGRVADPR